MSRKIDELYSAAMILRGRKCRYKVLHMSDAPVLTPFTKLSDFVSLVGERPSQESMNTYLNRMREQGSDISKTVRKALKCGAEIAKEVR